MKRFPLFVAICLLISGCAWQSDLDEVTQRVDEIDGRVTYLEELCASLNTNVTSLQSVVDAIEKNDYVTNVTNVMSGGQVVGYTFSFENREPEQFTMALTARTVKMARMVKMVKTVPMERMAKMVKMVLTEKTAILQ